MTDAPKLLEEKFNELWHKPFNEYMTIGEIEVVHNLSLISLRSLVLKKAREMLNMSMEGTSGP